MGEPKTVHRYTVQEYLAMEEVAEYRSEYFEGEIFAMSGGSGNHSRIALDCANAIGEGLKDGNCEVFNSDLKVRIENSSAYYYPDISVVCGGAAFEDPAELILKNPIIIFEVLSESTESFDRGKKFHRYKQISTLVEYILIAQSEPQIDAFYKVDYDTWMHRSYAGLEGVLELKSLSIQIKLADIYRRVQFA
jgi:Uma2 family endonuclease